MIMTGSSRRCLRPDSTSPMTSAGGCLLSGGRARHRSLRRDVDQAERCGEGCGLTSAQTAGGGEDGGQGITGARVGWVAGQSAQVLNNNEHHVAIYLFQVKDLSLLELVIQKHTKTLLEEVLQ